MSHVVILGVFVADTAYRADRMPVMGETVLGNSFSLGPGGKGSNQAVAAGRLGVKVSMISRLGKDDFGQMAIDTWKSSGVTPYIEEDVSSYTGAAFIFIEENSGNNAIIISPGAAANISPKDLEKRKDLIEKIKNLIIVDQNPNKLYSDFKILKEDWHNTGQVPINERNNSATQNGNGKIKRGNRRPNPRR